MKRMNSEHSVKGWMVNGGGEERKRNEKPEKAENSKFSEHWMDLSMVIEGFIVRLRIVYLYSYLFVPVSSNM